MVQRTSLIRDAMVGATITAESESADFWQKPLGKNAKSEGVRQQYIKDSANGLVNKTVIFYETMSGARMGDNPYGIFEYLRSHPEHGSFLHVWSIDAHSTIPVQYKDAPDVIFVRRNTHSYTYFLANAGYVVCNANLPAFYIRRPGQRYLNTWHGVPYKTLGRNTPNARFGSPAGNSTFTKATHILTPCEFTTDKILSGYSMKGVSNAAIAEIGYPRVDRTLNADESQKMHLKQVLGLVDDQTSSNFRPTVLYAPTWRSENDKDVVDPDQLMEDLEALSGLNVQLMYRGHHRMDRLIKDASVGEQLSNVIIPSHEISSNDLMTVVDILITDYSSIFFDFLPTGRPVVHYLYDLDDYKSSRGLNIGTEDLPGTVVVSRPELVNAVSQLSVEFNSYDSGHDFSSNPLQGERYSAAQDRFCPHDDGRASKRAVEFFIEGLNDGMHTRSAKDGRPTAAFWAGDLRPGPAANDFLENLLKSAHSSLEQTVLIVERKAPIDKGLLQSIKKLKDVISTYSYDLEKPIVLPEEEADYTEFASEYYLEFKTAKSRLHRSETLREIYSREYRRRLDDAKFDRVFLASGLSNDELALASFAGQGPTTTANQWTPSPRTTESRAERIAAAILPKGSSRRNFVTAGYRALRKQARVVRR